MRRLFWLAPVIVGLAACTDPSSTLPNYGVVPRFSLTDSLGRSFDSSVLIGKVWVVDFIFTNCPGPCPLMTSKMHTLQRPLAGAADVRFLSISVDPQNDTPAVLNAFAHKFGGPAGDWYFLTGAPGTIHQLARNVFKAGDLIQNMDHSTHFMLVDKKGNLRGYYSTEEEAAALPALSRDLELLRHERL